MSKDCVFIRDALNTLTSPTICVPVGEPDAHMQDFYVHQSVVIPRSEFFARALRGDWKEAQERKISLPDIEIEVFYICLKLLYDNMDESCESTAIARMASDQPFLILGKLYVLTERLIDEKTQSSVRSAINLYECGEFKGIYEPQLVWPSIESINIIYNGTPENSAARRWIVDMYVQCVDLEPDLFPSAPGFPHDFLVDLIKNVVTSWPRLSTHISLENKLAETEGEHERSKEYARTKDEDCNELGAVNADLKFRADGEWQKFQRAEREIERLQNQVQKLKNKLRGGRDGTVRGSGKPLRKRFRDQVDYEGGFHHR